MILDSPTAPAGSPALSPVPRTGPWGRLALAVDAAWRLGPRPVALIAWHRLRRRAGWLHAALPDTVLPQGPLLGDAALAGPAPDWHGPFDPGAHALDLDLFAAGDIRPVWEENRLLAVPRLVLQGQAARAEALLRDWRAANPPFRGPAWACGQEAALRALHLCLAVGGASPRAPMRALLEAHARRIAATRAYAAAQDNNHAVSEPAGLLAIGLVLGDHGLAAGAARGLVGAVARLVAPDGGFAQASPGYHRLLLDTLAVAEWLRRRHGAPPFAAPFAARAAAATDWLARVMAPGGALPRCGAVDDSAFADLSGCGPDDARGSLERAARLFRGASAGIADDPGCIALGIPCPPARLPRAASWRSAGWMGREAGPLRAILRTGVPLRFRPAQADLLHLDLWRGDVALLRDGGTGAYNPGPDATWWTCALADTAGHNTVEFDGEAQMPRLSRFLYARWPRCRAVPDGAALTDWRGRRHERRLRLDAGGVAVEDRLAGPFATVALRWRLAPGDWRATQDGAVQGAVRIALAADAACAIALVPGWESPAYGVVRPATVLELRAAAPVSRLVTRVEAG